ncbi:MAG TPA: UvrD-helicase domain-containing protein [Tissierellia bacterium]|nr:UvrD-helicase domain-containing protein [Tissierellia bacterium]
MNLDSGTGGEEMVELNKNQKKAVETIDKNVSVNAGAGSGKTKVLVERYLYILENGKIGEGKEVDSIVAITFTKKASQEMKERIRDELRNKFSLDKKWRRIYRDLERGNISTIHSFCSKILRENPVEANIDPQFKVLEDYKSDEILYEVIKSYLLKGIETNNNIYDFVKSFNVYSLDNLIYTIMGIYKKIRSTGTSFSEVGEITLNNIENAKFQEDNIFWIKDEFEYLMGKGRKNSKVVKLKEDPVWVEFSEKESYDEKVLDILPYLKDNIGSMKGEEERISVLVEAIDSALKAKEHEKKKLYEILIQVLIDIDILFTKDKKELGYLDYEDLQLMVLKLLDNNSIRRKYQDRFKYIMVDEFQDTNELQRSIIYKLSSVDSKLDRENLFIVGDPKQSIYGFRGADVDVFYDVIEDIEEVSNIKPIKLEENYRTVHTVLDFVNILFEKIMGSKYVALKPVKKSLNDLDVEILGNENLEVPEGESSGDYNKYYESRLIAKRIKALVDERRYEYKDFALLFRSSTEDYIYEEAFKEYGIPYYNLGGKGFYKQEEIVDLMNGLKGICNVYDTISIVGALRSPMFGLSDKTIYWLLRQEEDCILDALKKEIPYIEEKERKKMKSAYTILNKLILKRNMLSSYELIKELVESTYYNQVLMLKYGGKQRVSNIYKFLEMAREYTEEENGTIEDFIGYVEEMKRKGIDESQAKIQSEDGNSVKLMTIHKSKGLQFKVVIIPQMAKKFNIDTSSILFEKGLGLGIKHEDISPVYDEIYSHIQEKEERENKRILYVAMTRAEERLILGNQGRTAGFKKFINEFLGFVEYELIEELEIEKGLTDEVKDLGGSFKEIEPVKTKSFPILGEIPGVNQKKFKNFSITQYITFKDCKRRFFMKYYKNLPIDGHEEIEKEGKYVLKPTVRGNIVHKFCELYRIGKNKNDLLNDIIISFGLKPTYRVLNEVKPYIINYIDNYSEDYDKMYNEKEFYYKVGNDFVFGIIDRMYIKDGSIEIIDFKTNKADNKEELIDRYSPQLQLYTKACKDIYGLEVKKASLLLLETGELLDVDIGKEALDKNLKNIDKFIKYVSNNNSIEDYERKEICSSYCNFNIICND